MYRNYIFDNINHALPILMRDVVEKGETTGSRNGTVSEITHVGITLMRPYEREIIVNGRKPNIAAQIAETMWVLSGRNDVEFLSLYLPRAKEFSDDGETWRGGYGRRLRNWFGGVDQLEACVELLRADPLTRRAVMQIFDPGNDFAPSKDIPCNNWISFSNRLGKLDMHVGVRSNDLMWGWSGINAFEWSALQEIVAGMVGVQVGALHFSITSLHLYDIHLTKAKTISENSRRQTLVMDAGLVDTPRFNATGVDDTHSLDKLFSLWFKVEQDIRDGSPGVDELIDNFPEPMLQSWLRVLRWWWTGNHMHLRSLGGTRLEYATHVSVQPPKRARATEDKFTDYVIDLHTQKDAAYGDSWKKRGEVFSILPNIARKVDRLVSGKVTDDENMADTAIDLFVYLAKYFRWLQGRDANVQLVNDLIWAASDPEATRAYQSVEEAADFLDRRFEALSESVLSKKSEARLELVSEMLAIASTLSRDLWEATQSDEYHGADAD